MNILYISPRFPYPPHRGDTVVIYNHLRFLSKRNKITLLTMVENEKELEGLAELSRYCVNIETFKRRPAFSMLNFVLAACRTEPFTVIRYYSPRMFRRSRELIESSRFDVVHAAFYYMGQYLISKKIKIPKTTAAILDTHNVEYLIYSRYVGLTRDLLRKLFIKLESLRIKGYELKIYEKFDKCIAFSKLDRKNIMELSASSANVVINPACMELPVTQQPGRWRDEEANTIVYFGLLNTLANEDGIRFFYEDIFPLVKKEIQDVKFFIAGKLPSRYITGLARDPAVKVVGLVPDIREFLKKRALVIVPLRLGGGIRIKILEAWTMGKAVVSTSIGAEGVQIRDGVDIIIADSAPAFAKEVVRLLKDKAKREEIGEAALKKVAEYYNPERVISGLEDIYKKTLEEKAIKWI